MYKPTLLAGLTLLFLATCITPLRAQTTPSLDQVQAVVEGLATPHQALHMDEALRMLDGVKVSRTDLHTRNLYLLIDSDRPLSAADLNAAIAPQGLSIRCFVRGPRQEGPFHHLDPAQCAETPDLR